MKNVFYVSAIMLVVFFSCDKKNPQPTPLYTYVYDYYLEFEDSVLTKVLQSKSGIAIKEDKIEHVNDSVYTVITYNTNKQVAQKSYYYTLASGLSYRSIDSVKSERLIGEFVYEYDVQGYVTRCEYTAQVFSSDYSSVTYNIQGTVDYVMELGNVKTIIEERSIQGAQNYTEKKIMEYSYSSEQNTLGVQFFMLPFKGTANKNLATSIQYTYYKNSEIIQQGVYTYSFGIDTKTKRIMSEVELYTPKNVDGAKIKTYRNYSYL